MSIADIVQRAREAWDRGATEVTLQGGIHPEFTGDFYVRVTQAIKAELPDMHIHGFTPLEVWQGAEDAGGTGEGVPHPSEGSRPRNASRNRCRDSGRRCPPLPVSGQDPDLPVGTGDVDRP